ncbi:type I 3-dehydroquinate dehydratase [Varibaculum cambriense]|uniref:type I 3-dehydroquinate dehydratase n=1 Tax=Varibaculum cambriense TaxID=184870 RepID=UPI00255709FE|nr:type I 3-dehydroquinate dehydratase [Varibaculum cambriense]MDK8273968.1 type I 3-dehydroquinate dehydratase [Varibaculum cambriense]
MEPGSLFSPGRPALIVPLTGTNQVELRGQISRIPQAADLVEWRLDLLRDYHNPAYLREIVEAVAPVIKLPWLATCRSKHQGGGSRMVPTHQFETMKMLVKAGASVLDIEDDFSLATEALAYAHDLGVVSVLSRHYFAAAEAEKMDRESIYNWLAAAHERGAQVAKLALTITSAQHLLAVFTAMENYYQDTAGKRPFLVAGMGPLGTASRLVGGVFGNCATFAVLPGAEPSAPGQVTAALQAEVLSALGKEES